MYHPTLGRWVQRDPSGYVDGMSLYEYVRSSPTMGLDHAGLQEWPPTSDEFYLMGHVVGGKGHMPLEEAREYMRKLEAQRAWEIKSGYVYPSGLSSRQTKYWHYRGYGAEKIKAGPFEVEHSVISVDRSQTEGVDFAPPAKKENGKKKISLLGWVFGGVKGRTKLWEINIQLDYSKTSEKWRLCIKNTESMKDPAGGKDIECKCATEDQVKACIEAVAKEWNKKTWRSGHDCRHFVKAAESGGFPGDGPFSKKGCCLEPCSN